MRVAEASEVTRQWRILSISQSWSEALIVGINGGTKILKRDLLLRERHSRESETAEVLKAGVLESEGRGECAFRKHSIIVNHQCSIADMKAAKNFIKR